MRIVSAIVVVTLGLTVACANRSDTGATAGAGAQTSGTTARSGAAGAQAAARLTEADYDRIMKRVGPTNAAMRMKLMSNMLADAGEDALLLSELFGEAERFWAQHNKPDAVKWAQQARANASGVAGAATAGDAMKAQMAANNMLASCKQCHGAYREMDPSGSGFRMKPGTIAE